MFQTRDILLLKCPNRRGHFATKILRAHLALPGPQPLFESDVPYEASIYIVHILLLE